MIWVGAAIVVLTFVGIILKFDTKLCLILGGALMCLLGGGLSQAVPAYCASLVNGTIVYYTCISLGYSTVMKTMGCTDHVIYAALGPLSKVKKGLVPLTTIITWFFMQALSSAATCAAVEGTIMIPIMTALGVPAATATAAILIGTGIGPSLNPGGTFYVASAQADPLGEASGVGMVSAAFVPGCIALVLGGIGVMIMGKILDKNDAKGSEEEAKKAMEAAGSFKVNPLYAVMPLIPLFIILIANYTPLLDAKIFDVPTCMFCGFVLALIVFMKDYKTVSTAFFRGQGDAFFSIITLMAAAAVFVKGMNVIGIITAIVEAMKANPSIAKFGAAYIPMIIAMLSGSGNAACFAFIESVLPHSHEIGIDHNKLSVVCCGSGSWGRSWSPVAAVTVVLCGISGSEPMDVIKLTAVPLIIIAAMYIIVLL